MNNGRRLTRLAIMGDYLDWIITIAIALVVSIAGHIRWPSLSVMSEAGECYLAWVTNAWWWPERSS